ncbi:MAG: hypothetical protein AAFR93_05955 [Pseudomonadota bacterium]
MSFLTGSFVQMRLGLVCALALASTQTQAQALELFRLVALSGCLGAIEAVQTPLASASLQVGTDPSGLLDWCSYAVPDDDADAVLDYFDNWAAQMVAIERYVPLPGPERILDSFEWREPVIRVSLISGREGLVFRVEELNQES